jgi:hypothetical protein
MLDSLFWWTGLTVWVAVVVTVVLFLPVVCGMVVAWPAYKLASWLESRYYDDATDVEVAKSDGVWYYHAIDKLYTVRDLSVAFMWTYTERVLEPTVGRILP